MILTEKWWAAELQETQFGLVILTMYLLDTIGIGWAFFLANSIEVMWNKFGVVT